MLESISACALLTLALSKHISAENDFNEVHPSVGITCQESPIGEFSAGYFLNSEKDDTLWFAKRERLDFSEQVFYEYGVAVGYSYSVVVPFVRLGYDFGMLEVFVAPAFETYANENKLIPVVGLQFKYEF